MDDGGGGGFHDGAGNVWGQKQASKQQVPRPGSQKLPAQPQICCNLLLRAKIWRFWDTYDLHFKTILLPNTKYHPIASAQLGLIAAS
jgi:hypothetical protein